MLGPLGEDFAKVKASITTALDKITQVVKKRLGAQINCGNSGKAQTKEIVLYFFLSLNTSTGSTVQRREALTTSLSRLGTL